MIWLVPAAAFFLAVAVVFGAYHLLVRLPDTMARRRIQGRIDEVSLGFGDSTTQTIIKRALEGPLPALDKLAASTRQGSSLARLIEQAGVKISVSAVILAGMALALLCGVIAATAIRMWSFTLGAVVIGFFAPILFLRRKRTVRQRRFEEQFPEALDLLSRAIRAGHAFTTAMGMVADESPDPVGPEFKKTFDEQNYGLPLKDALNAMSERMPILDVRFFVTAVVIQRETGGNLAEILDNLAHVVRERFKILRQVRVYTAHGRLTGYVLLALPATLAVALTFINRDHINLLFTERMGQMMVGGAIVMQTVGYLWIRKIVRIEV